MPLQLKSNLSAQVARARTVAHEHVLVLVGRLAHRMYGPEDYVGYFFHVARFVRETVVLHVLDELFVIVHTLGYVFVETELRQETQRADLLDGAAFVDDGLDLSERLGEYGLFDLFVDSKASEAVEGARQSAVQIAYLKGKNKSSINYLYLFPLSFSSTKIGFFVIF